MKFICFNPIAINYILVELISSSHSDVPKNMLSFRVYVTKRVHFMIIQSGLINKNVQNEIFFFFTSIG